MFTFPFNLLKTSAFTPADIVTLGWWDPSDTSTITSSGGNVSQVDDKSGNARHLVQATGADQPETGTRTINSLNVLDCDGTEWMHHDNFPVTGGDINIWLVAEIDSIDSQFDSVFSMDNGGSNDFQFDADNATAFDGRINVDDIGADVSLTSGPFAGPAIYHINMDKTGAGIYNAFIDGTQRAANTTYSGTLDTTPNFQIFINKQGNNPPNGAFAECIITTDDTSQTDIVTYLKNKYGIA